MIFDGYEHLASAGRAAAGRKNGRKSKGRPPNDWTPEQLACMEKHWDALRHATNEIAVEAMNRSGLFKRPLSVNVVWSAMTKLRGKGNGGSGRGTR